MRERLRKVEVGQKVVIEHMGLDMTFAWDPIEEIIKELHNLTDLEYRLLMMAADRSDLSQFDSEVKHWLLTGSNQVEKIRNEMASLQKTCQKEHRTFAYDVRTYCTIPFVHGLRIVEPFHAAYITICRWDGVDFNKFRWGRNEYHRVIDASLSGAQADLLDVFNGNFLHYWKLKETTASQQAADLLQKPPSQQTPSLM